MTADPRYQYCKLYVRSHDRREVLELIADLVDGRANDRSVSASGIDFDVRQNPDLDESRMTDFLFWPTIVDIAAGDATTGEAMVGQVSRVLEGAWKREIPTVAACPFEDSLPWSGGIDRVTS